jgi:hypothetical protein
MATSRVELETSSLQEKRSASLSYTACVFTQVFKLLYFMPNLLFIIKF